MVKQLKNRYNDPTINQRFVIGIDRSRMKLYDAEASAQVNITNSGQAANTISNKATQNKFKQLKVG
jgi:hypothetical protein